METVPQELRDRVAGSHHREIIDHLAALCDKNPAIVISLRRKGDDYQLTVSARQYADTGKQKIVPPLTATGKPKKLDAELAKMLKQLEATPDPVEEKPEEPKEKKAPAKKPAKPKPKDETPELPLEEKKSAPVSSGWTF